MDAGALGTPLGFVGRQRELESIFDALALDQAYISCIIGFCVDCSQSSSGKSGSALAISYDSTTRRLTVAPVQLDPGPGDAELWVIPVGSSEAISLGVIDAGRPVTHQLAPAQARLVAAGATFAISLEPRGGSPTGHATGPIVASGKLVET